jgi:hypothetical protein
MEDAELILRFFSLRHADNFQSGLERFFNLYMIRSLNFSDEDIKFLKNLFLETLTLAHTIYEETLFKPFDPESNTWKNRAHKAYYDAVMVGFSRNLPHANVLVERKLRVIEKTKELFREDESKLLIGAGRTKADIQERLRLFDDMLSQVIGE